MNDMNNKICNNCVVESCCNERCEDFKIYIKNKTMLLNRSQKRELCDSLFKLKHCSLCKNSKEFIYDKLKHHIAITCNYCGGIYHYNSFIRDNKFHVSPAEFFPKSQLLHSILGIKTNLNYIIKELDKVRLIEERITPTDIMKSHMLVRNE